MTNALQGHPATADLGDDLLGRLGPDERGGVLVVVGDVVLDGPDQFGNAAEALAMAVVANETLFHATASKSMLNPWAFELLELVGRNSR